MLKSVSKIIFFKNNFLFYVFIEKNCVLVDKKLCFQNQFLK